MAVMNRTNLSYAVDEAVTEVAYAELFEGPMLWPSLYRLRPSSRKNEVVASFGEAALYSVKLEGQEMTTDEVTQQFKKTFVHTAYAKLLKITRELIEDEDWSTLEDMASQLGQKANETMENSAVGPFNDAFNGANFVGEDNKALCHTAHVNADGANSQGNSGTQSLDHAGCKETRKLMRKFKGYDANQKIIVNPNELLLPIDLEEEAFALLESTLLPGSNNNDANMFSGRYRAYIWHWLSDTNAWFMMDSRLRQQYLRWYQRIGYEINADASFTQGIRRIGAYMRYINGFTNWRFLYGNNPS